VTSSDSRFLLWLDDDPKHRYSYEEEILASDGWTIVWASSVVEAAQALKRRLQPSMRIRALLLDQMTPWAGELDHQDIWSGCKLLSWLRGNAFPSGYPWPEDDRTKGISSLGKPVPYNRSLPVLILSGFDDDDVARATKAVDDVPMLSKPVDLHYLRFWLASKVPLP